MLTIHQIARKTNRLRQEGARFVRFTDLKKGYMSNGNGYIAGASYSTHVIGSDGRPKVNEQPSKYVTVIEFIDSELHVHVGCSCSDFTYRWEWALWNRGAAEIEYSNGDSPDTNNPTYKPAMCISKGTLVTMRDGMKPIEQVAVGDEVLTLNGYRKVEYSGLTRKNANVSSITTSSKRNLKCTPDHKVLCLKMGSPYPEWVEASEVKVGDFLITQLPYQAGAEVETLDSLYAMLGIVISESDERHFAPFGEAEQEEYARFYKDVFGELPKLQPLRLNLSKKDKARFKKLGIVLGNSNKHRIPSWMFQGTNAQRVSLLYGLFQGDGWIGEDGRAATLGTSSKRLARDYQKLLLSFGIHSTITLNRHQRVSSTLTMYLVRPTMRGTWILVSLLPHLAKYMREREVTAMGSYKENVYPVGNTLVLEELKRAVVKKIKSSIANELVGGRQFFAAQGWMFSDSMPAEIKKLPSYAKVKSLHTYKPQAGALAHDLIDLRFSKMERSWFRYIPKKIMRLESKDSIHSYVHSCVKIGLVNLKDVAGLLQMTAPNVVYEEVKSVDDVRKSVDVYDLTIEDTPHFSANGFVVHNCKHALALYLKIKPKLPAPKPVAIKYPTATPKAKK